MPVALTPDAYLSRSGTAWDVYFSWCGWRRIDTDRSQFTILAYLGNSLVSGGFQFTANASRRLIVYRVNNFADLLGGTGPILGVGEWWFLGLTTIAADTANNVVIYWARQSDPSLSSATVSFAGAYNYNQHYVGARPGADGANGAYRLHGSAALDRSWRDTTLTPSEMLAEFQSSVPVKAGVWANWPMATAATAGDDTSGNGRPLTATTGTGSIATTDGPFDAETVTGALTATLPAATSDLTGSASAGGSSAATIPAFSIDIAGDLHTGGEAAAALPAATADLGATSTASGVLGPTLPILEASSEGAVEATGAVDGTLPSLEASLTGAASASGSADAALPTLDTSAAARAATSGPIDATLAPLVASLTSVEDAFADIDAVLPALNTAMATTASATSESHATLPALATALNGRLTASASLASGLPVLVASLAADEPAVNASFGTYREAGYYRTYRES